MNGRIDPSLHPGPAVGHQVPIHGPEPWRQDGDIVWPHWDLRFCAVALQRRADLLGAPHEDGPPLGVVR